MLRNIHKHDGPSTWTCGSSLWFVHEKLDWRAYCNQVVVTPAVWLRDVVIPHSTYLVRMYEKPSYWLGMILIDLY